MDVSITLIQAIYPEQGYWAYKWIFLMKPLLLLKGRIAALYPILQNPGRHLLFTGYLL